jgi:DNA helicase IV
VALHRVAYLLYTHRERLARSGVLVVGPSAGFIHYVGGVLPALGESAVVFTTPGRLAHGVVASAVDPDEVARAKGGLAMLDVLRRAVADRQELPGSPISIQLDDVTVEIDAATAAEARGRARAPACRTTRPAPRSATRSAGCSSSRASSGSTRTWRTRPSSPTSSASSASSRTSRRSRRPARRS